MKKLVSVLCMMVMLISLFSVTDMVQASSDINIIINGVEQKYDVMPIIQNGRTLVPMRGIFEALGADVTWIEPTRTVVGSRDRKYVKLRIDSDTYYSEQKILVFQWEVNGECGFNHYLCGYPPIPLKMYKEFLKKYNEK